MKKLNTSESETEYELGMLKDYLKEHRKEVKAQDKRIQEKRMLPAKNSRKQRNSG